MRKRRRRRQRRRGVGHIEPRRLGPDDVSDVNMSHPYGLGGSGQVGISLPDFVDEIDTEICAESTPNSTLISAPKSMAKLAPNSMPISAPKLSPKATPNSYLIRRRFRRRTLRRNRLPSDLHQTIELISPCQMFIRSFVRSFLLACACLFVYSFTRWFICVFV